LLPEIEIELFDQKEISIITTQSTTKT